MNKNTTYVGGVPALEFMGKGQNHEIYRVRIAPRTHVKAAPCSEKTLRGLGEPTEQNEDPNPLRENGSRLGKSLRPSHKGGRPRKSEAEKRKAKRDYQRQYRQTH